MRYINNVAVLTSGGDAPGMNACIRAVVRTAIFNGMRVYGIERGYHGLVTDAIRELQSTSVSNIIQRGGTILKTSRSEDFRTPEGRKKAYENLRKRNIDGLVVIGGDGSFTGAKIFGEEYPDISIVGCPGTIDNDIAGTDFTIGFDTALNTVVECVDKIRDTAASHDRLFFIEVMGRDSGMIALQAGISVGAEAILIPEIKTYSEHLIDKLRKGWLREKSSNIIIVAEGDASGGAYKLAEKVKTEFPQFDMRVSVLGHMQRGGKPSCADRFLASRMGYAAIEALSKGKTGLMIGIQNNKMQYVSFEKAIRDESKIKMRWMQVAEILSL